MEENLQKVPNDDRSDDLVWPAPADLRLFMRPRFFAVGFIVWSVAVATAVVAQAQPADKSFFVTKLYPILHTAQCVRCHSDNGVASETELKFSPDDAKPEEIAAFGLALLDLVDRKQPDQSLLLQKPTRAARLLRSRV